MARRKPKYQIEAEAAGTDSAANSKPQPNRVIADLSQQAPHNSYAGGPLYYEDRPFRCVDCGCEEVWTAEQQKWWYETAKGPIYSTAVRCHACRDARRKAHGGTPRKFHDDRRKDATES